MKIKFTTPLLSLMLSLAVSANAQQDNAEQQEYSGVWTAVAQSEQAQGRCGRVRTLTELEITGLVPDTKHPTYEGDATVWITTERCPTMMSNKSKARLVVRGTRVSASFEGEGWGNQMLVREGNTLSGIDANGLSLEWHQPTELPVNINTNMVNQNIITELTRSELEGFKAELLASGSDASEVDALAAELVAGVAKCIIDVAKLQSAVQRLPYSEILKMIDPISGDEPNPRVVRRLDSLSTDVRVEVCAYKLSIDMGLEKPN